MDIFFELFWVWITIFLGVVVVVMFMVLNRRCDACGRFFALRKICERGPWIVLGCSSCGFEARREGEA